MLLFLNLLLVLCLNCYSLNELVMAYWQVFCYALTPSDGSEWRLRTQSEAEHFKDVSSMSSDAIARLINEDNIQILVNLNGYTKVPCCWILEFDVLIVVVLNDVTLMDKKPKLFKYLILFIFSYNLIFGSYLC